MDGDGVCGVVVVLSEHQTVKHKMARRIVVPAAVLGLRPNQGINSILFLRDHPALGTPITETDMFLHIIFSKRRNQYCFVTIHGTADRLHNMLDKRWLLTCLVRLSLGVGAG